MRARLPSFGLSFGAVLLAGGCTTLGGNVQGDFACRAPDGTCAPTSVIDEQATNTLPSVAKPQAGTLERPRTRADARTLRVIVAGFLDSQGRTHEARVVHVELPESPAARHRAPLSTGDVLRALGDVSQTRGDAAPSPHEPSSPLQLPERLVIPSQAAPEMPGANAPDTGASGRSPSPGRVPHPHSREGEPR